MKVFRHTEGQAIVAQWRLMVTQIWVNIGPGIGLLPDGTKPLPEPIWAYQQRSSVPFFWGQFLIQASIRKMSLKITF